MRPRGKRAGFTLLELSIASGILLMIGLALMDTVLMASRSQEAVFDGAAENRELREVSQRITEDLKVTQAGRLALEVLAGGNSQVTFQAPIQVGGVDVWGIEEPGVMGGVAQQDWSLRYTVVTGSQRRLVRQVLDDLDEVRKSKVLLEGLSQDPEVAGFTVEQTGDLWAVTLALRPDGGTKNGRQLAFQFRLRN